MSTNIIEANLPALAEHSQEHIGKNIPWKEFCSFLGIPDNEVRMVTSIHADKYLSRVIGREPIQDGDRKVWQIGLFVIAFFVWSGHGHISITSAEEPPKKPTQLSMF